MTIPNKHPQEIEVWYILPAIRKELVIALKERNLSQKEIAKLLNVTEPAVSQYAQEKRAQTLVFNKGVKEFIKTAALQIKDSRSAYQGIQNINDFIKHSKARCEIHMQLEKGLCNCDICYRK